MALSDSAKYQGKPSGRRRAVNADTNKHWSDSQKIEAVTTYLALGELRLTAAVLKIPEITLRVWKQKEWWKDIERELRTQEDLVLSARLQKIISKSLEQVEDRLSHGDFIYDQKTGQLVRKPVSMKDAHKVSMDMVDKREALLNRQPVTQTLEAVDSRLEKLAQKFAELANQAKKPTIEVTDVIVGQATDERETVDAVHEEWQEGLQDGVREVSFEAGTDQEPLGADDRETAS